MKILPWTCFGIVVTGLALWIVVGDFRIRSQFLFGLIIASIFVVSPLGTFWMLYRVIRHEQNQMPYVVLAFLPYFFLGYYLERVRGGKLEKGHLRNPKSKEIA